MKKVWTLMGLLSCLVWAPASFAATSAQTYAVKKGDTLDRVIHRTLGESPLKIELLRKAFIQHNPHAFINTSPSLLRAGAVLVVPNHDELLLQHLRPLGVVRTDPNDRRHWVRYP